MKFRLAVLFCLTILLNASAISAQPQQFRTVAEGVQYGHYTTQTEAGPLSIHVLRTDLQSPGIRILTIPGHDDLARRERPSDTSRRYEWPWQTVIAATNGDLGGRRGTTVRNVPRSMLMMEGRFLTGPIHRATFAITADNEPHIAYFEHEIAARTADGSASFAIDWYNKWYDYEIGALFTAEFHVSEEQEFEVVDVILIPGTDALPVDGEVNATVESLTVSNGGTPIPEGRFCLQLHADRDEWVALAEPGTKLVISSKLTPEIPGMHGAISGAGWIVSEGEYFDSQRRERLQDSFYQARHPRTAIGYTEDRRTLLQFVVDGRQPELSVGVTLPELAEIMIENGTYEGLNIDGGGSSVMLVEGQIMNSPSDPDGERAVTSSVLIARKLR